ncbi:MAG: GGDEF domain-containing protein [Sulfurimonas sp.]
MAGTIKSKKRKDIASLETKNSTPASSLKKSTSTNPSSGIETYSKDVLRALIKDNLPPTPNNFSLYFDRLLEDKSENLRKEVVSMLELEDANDDENTIVLEKNLKKGFASIKNMLSSAAILYKNMSLMTKILEKRKKELSEHLDSKEALKILKLLGGDVSKLSTILKTQSSQMKEIYDDTAIIIKGVEKETIFDNAFGVYNKRYLLTKIEQEIGLIEKFEHNSSLIMIELSKELKHSVKNDKAIMLMTKTLARLLLKTSRRSDIVAHYGNGVFAMLLKHTDIESAKKASERVSYLVSNSNFFLADKEIQLKVSIGITNISAIHSVEEIVVSSMNGIDESYKDSSCDYAVSLRNL